MRALAVGLAGSALLLVSACGTPTLSGSKVADQVSSKLAASAGREPDKVTCPELKGEKGEKIRCTLTDGGTSYGVTVTVTKVEGSNVAFHAEVDNQPKS